MIGFCKLSTSHKLVPSSCWYPHHVVARKLLPANHSMTLDVGCGEGSWLNSLGKESVGLDVDGKHVRIAKQRECEVVIGDAHYLPFKEEVFDLVTFLEVIEHLGSPSQALRDIHRVLSTNGKLIMTTPNLNDPVQILFNFVPSKVRVHTRPCEIHRGGWDYITLRDLLFYSGFDIEKRAGDVIRPLPTPIAKAFANIIPSLAYHIAVRARKK